MRPVSEKMTDGWKREDKTGDYRPTARVTIQRIQLQRFPYSTRKAAGGDWDHQRYRKGNYTSIIFGDESRPIELRGIKSVSWDRSLEQDVATCTVVMKNTELVAIGQRDDSDDSRHGGDDDSHSHDQEDYDQPGQLTYNRGIEYDDHGWHHDPDAEETNRWGYGGNRPWRNLIVPDRLVKTYEGYGSDYSEYPAEDKNMAISGTWLIDTVELNHEGDIQIEMRDVGRMLLSHICFPPAVPYAEYPLAWSKIQTVQVDHRDAQGGSWKNLKGMATASSSNTAYAGEGLKDPPYKYYVTARGVVNGHHPNHAIDAEDPGSQFGWQGKYWLSTGQTRRHSFVWWEAEFNKLQDVAGIRIDPIGGPYRIYISVKTDDGWLGRKKIPYNVTTEDIDNGAKIPFVQQVWADRWNLFDVIFKRKYRNVRKIRLTFTTLTDTKVGNYPWRAALRDMKVYTGKYDDLHFGKGKIFKTVGNYRDYTQVVKWMCAWGGFYWPPQHTKRDFWTINEDTRNYVHYLHHDQGTFVDGRVWGSFQPTGTFGEADLTVDLFDKKPFMDVINYVRDVVGFIFMIDEWGGVVWRMPNLYERGNYVAPEPIDLDTRARRSRSDEKVILDEKETLLSYSTTLNSENLRDRIFVANATGKIGIAIRGFNPTYEAFRRTAGWTDQNFKTEREARVMADMIAAQQMFNYRRTKTTTPGYPKIQLDDQIRIYERKTNETYWHYVLGISSELDMETGQWIYSLDTHWLGSDREDAWLVDVYKLDGVTKNYLQVLKGTHNMPD